MLVQSDTEKIEQRHYNTRGCSKEEENNLFPLPVFDRTRSNRLKLQQGRFILGITENFNDDDREQIAWQVWSFHLHWRSVRSEYLNNCFLQAGGWIRRLLEVSSSSTVYFTLVVKLQFKTQASCILFTLSHPCLQAVIKSFCTEKSKQCYYSSDLVMKNGTTSWNKVLLDMPSFR